MPRRAGARAGGAAGADAPGAWLEARYGAVEARTCVGSSGWSSAYRYDAGGRRFFVKTSREGGAEAMFRGEALGLGAMAAAAEGPRVPEVLYAGTAGSGGADGAFIVMEHLEFASGGVDQEELGRRLARMHLAEPSAPEAAAGRFGFPVGNTIGGTPQPNGWMDDWADFFWERRLGYQLRLAGDTTLSRLGEKLREQCFDSFFEGMDIRPCILHGDLWSGNIAAAGPGEPAVFDPASYFGHSEAEFGMSWCAGFSGAFWGAYRELVPQADGFDERADLYRLYHYLNHYNLFGSGYYGQCESILRKYVQ